MHNLNTSNNGEPLDSAYNFHSFSSFINNGLQSRFSPQCIFCPSRESIALLNDGSFRQCNRCKKQFKALLIRN